MRSPAWSTRLALALPASKWASVWPRSPCTEAFAELLVREAEHFLPIPDGVSDRDAAAVILNYVTAWQMIHRVAKVQPGQTALVTGAAGGVGTAALQLLRLAGVKTYGAASAAKHDTLRSLGATPIDYRAGPLDRLTRALEPEGVDYVFDASRRRQYRSVHRRAAAGRHAGRIRFHGRARNAFPSWPCSPIFSSARACADGVGTFYGITMLYRKDPQPLREDLPKIFALLAEKKIDPLVNRTFPLLEARQALELLATGSVEGKIVLTAELPPGRRLAAI